MAGQREPPSGMGILFLVVLIDLIGLTLVIPFLTYFVQDLAMGDGFTAVGERDLWVGKNEFYLWNPKWLAT